MPRSLPLNQFFVYLRGQAEASARARQGSATPDQGVGVNPPFPAPSGYRWTFVYEGSPTVYDGASRVIELVSN